MCYPRASPYLLCMAWNIPSLLSFQLRLASVPGLANPTSSVPSDMAPRNLLVLNFILQFGPAYIFFSLTFLKFLFIVPILAIQLVYKLQEKRSERMSLESLTLCLVPCVLTTCGCQGDTESVYWWPKCSGERNCQHLDLLFWSIFSCTSFTHQVSLELVYLCSLSPHWSLGATRCVYSCADCTLPNSRECYSNCRLWK